MNRRLIVLDDEPDVLESYRLILTPSHNATIVSSRKAAPVAPQEQFEVTYVDTGEKALSAILQGLSSGKPIVGGFFDVKLGGGIDGIETIRQAKDVDPNLLCCIVSAYQDRSIDEISKVFGGAFTDRWDFLTKPFSSVEILQKAHNLVANWNRKEREKEYIKQIQEHQHQEELIRELLDDILQRIKRKSEVALQETPVEEIKAVLKSILIYTEQADHIIRSYLTSEKGAEDQKPPLKILP